VASRPSVRRSCRSCCRKGPGLQQARRAPRAFSRLDCKCSGWIGLLGAWTAGPPATPRPLGRLEQDRLVARTRAGPPQREAFAAQMDWVAWTPVRNCRVPGSPALRGVPSSFSSLKVNIRSLSLRTGTDRVVSPYAPAWVATDGTTQVPCGRASRARSKPARTAVPNISGRCRRLAPAASPPTVSWCR